MQIGLNFGPKYIRNMVKKNNYVIDVFSGVEIKSENGFKLDYIMIKSILK